MTLLLTTLMLTLLKERQVTHAIQNQQVKTKDLNF